MLADAPAGRTCAPGCPTTTSSPTRAAPRSRHVAASGAPAGRGPLAEALAAVPAGDGQRGGADRAVARGGGRAQRRAGGAGRGRRRARAPAAAADARPPAADGVPMGPLHGIPVTVKDVIDVAGCRPGARTPLYHGSPDARTPPRSLGCASAGAVILGKAATHEFALGVTSPQSRNPWDPPGSPAGRAAGPWPRWSSGMGLGSLGTDTRASIRVPAALSGAVGFKPTYGRVPTDGVVSLSWTMDHVAPMALHGHRRGADAGGAAGRRPAAGHGAAGGRRPARRCGRRGVRRRRRRAGRAWCRRRSTGWPAPARRSSRRRRRPDARRPGAGQRRRAGGQPGRGGDVPPRRSGSTSTPTGRRSATSCRAATELAAVDYVDAQRSRGELARRLLGAFERPRRAGHADRARSSRRRSTTSPPT